MSTEDQLTPDAAHDMPGDAEQVATALRAGLEDFELVTFLVLI